MVLVVIGAIAFNPGVSQAKGGDDQDQIILLNDSAAALEDSNPGLSKGLTKFADEKEKEWEDKNANKNGPQRPVTGKNIPPLQYRIKLLRAAALAIAPTYPLIAKGLNKMANDINSKLITK
jgi:hypothetical protein